MERDKITIMFVSQAQNNQVDKKNSKGCELTMTNGNFILNPNNILKQKITKKQAHKVCKT